MPICVHQASGLAQVEKGSSILPGCIAYVGFLFYFILFLICDSVVILSILQCLQEDQDHVHFRPAPEEEAHLDVTKETIEKEIDTGTEGAEEGITENQMMAAEEAHRPEV